MSGGPTRQDTYRITVLIEDPATGNMLNHGVFDKKSGGDLDSDDTKYYPGGMVDPVSLGGRRTVSNLTVSRLYRLERDHASLQKMYDSVGRSDAVVSVQPLDIQGVVFGKPIVYNCKLKTVTTPEPDSEQSGAGMLQLEFTVTGFPTAS